MRHVAGRGVQEFFEGIDTLLKTRREDEVAFNLTFNKASLKKVIREYSSKDVGQKGASLPSPTPPVTLLTDPCLHGCGGAGRA